MGIWLGDCHFQRFANDREPAGNLVTEALKNAPTLKLLVVILPGKTPLYGKYFKTFSSSTFDFKNIWIYAALDIVSTIGESKLNWRNSYIFY